MTGGNASIERIGPAGRHVLVAGAGVSGASAARALRDAGARVTVTDASAQRLDELGVYGVDTTVGLDAPFPGIDLVVISPGWKPDAALPTAAAAAGIEVIGEVELAWWLDQLSGTPATWLAVTGTNGKTTAVGMLESMLHAAGLDAVACGNVGLPVVDAVRAGHQVLAVELSSFQLYWQVSLRAHGAAVLNLAEDHLDWHGSMAEYAAAKGRIYGGDSRAVFNVDDPWSVELAAGQPHRTGFTLAEPVAGQLGVSSGYLVDCAFDGTEPTPLAAVSEVKPDVPHNHANALAAAALARCVGVSASAVAEGLRAFHPGAHRAVTVAEDGGVSWVDDSKATNPHAVAASLHAHPRVVWIAGGLLKGAAVDDLVADVTQRLDAVVLLGRDRDVIAAALARHAPQVPVHEVAGSDDGAMLRAVRVAADLARPGTAVVLAPAAASMDMFVDYADRGRAFVEAVRAVLDERAMRGQSG